MSELYELPNGWEWKEWRDIVIIKNGKDYKAVLNENGKYPIYGSGGIMNYSDEYLCNENSVVIGRKGTINNPLFVKEKFWNIDTAFGLEAKKEILEPLFLYYFCLNYNFLQLNTSTTLPSLTKSNLQTIEMPFPPLSKQQRIVSKLDLLFEKIDKSIALHQKNMDEADAFMGSVLNEVFGELEEKYATVMLDELALFQNGFAFKSNEFNCDGNGLQVIRIGNVINIDKNPVYIKEKKEFEKFRLKPNDIAISMTGTRMKKDYLFVRIIDANNTYLNQRVGKISSKNNSNYKYLYFFLQSNSFRDKVFEFETGAVNQGNIGSKDIMNREIANAPLLIQQKVVNYLDEISQKTEKIKQLQKEKMDSLKALKASILDSAFRGEL